MIYLQICQATIALYFMAAATHYDMKPIATKYFYPNGDTVLVIDQRWIDSIGIRYYPVKPIDYNLTSPLVNVVFLNDTELVKQP